MRKSTVTAQDVARQTYDAMEKNRFLVLTHSITRKAWRMKRWMPNWYFQRIIKAARGPRPAQQGTGAQ